MSNAAVKCEVGGPANPVAPSAAPPNAHARPPNATTNITARNGGPANHWPQHPLPERSEGDLERKITTLLNPSAMVREEKKNLFCVNKLLRLSGTL